MHSVMPFRNPVWRVCPGTRPDAVPSGSRTIYRKLGCPASCWQETPDADLWPPTGWTLPEPVVFRKIATAWEVGISESGPNVVVPKVLTVARVGRIHEMAVGRSEFRELRLSQKLEVLERCCLAESPQTATKGIVTGKSEFSKSDPVSVGGDVSSDKLLTSQNTPETMSPSRSA